MPLQNGAHLLSIVLLGLLLPAETSKYEITSNRK